MGLTGWSTTVFLRRQSLVYDTYPFYISIWLYITPSTIDDQALAIGTDGSGDQLRAGIRSSGTSNNMQLHRRTTATDSTAQIAVTTGAWHHYGSEILAANAIGLLIDNANKQTSTANMVINTSNCVYIGIDPPVAAGKQWPGYIAEVSIWGGSMTEANMDSLTAKLFNGGAAGAGGNPLNITAEAAQPWSGQLKAYWINSANTITDLSGNGNDLTMVGTATDAASHPTIEAPPSPGDPVGSIRPRGVIFKE